MYDDREEAYDDLNMPLSKSSISELANQTAISRRSRRQDSVVVEPLFNENGDKRGHQAEEQAGEPKPVHPDVGGSGGALPGGISYRVALRQCRGCSYRNPGARPGFLRVVAGAEFATYAPSKMRPRRSGVSKGS